MTYQLVCCCLLAIRSDRGLSLPIIEV